MRLHVRAGGPCVGPSRRADAAHGKRPTNTESKREVNALVNDNICVKV